MENDSQEARELASQLIRRLWPGVQPEQSHITPDAADYVFRVYLCAVDGQRYVSALEPALGAGLAQTWGAIGKKLVQSVKKSMTAEDNFGLAIRGGIAAHRRQINMAMKHGTSVYPLHFPYCRTSGDPNEIFAANLIRRFVKLKGLGPMDEKGLAGAIYAECGTDMKMVDAVFAKLQSDLRYRSDSDDVAEHYVNILMSRGGNVERALQSSPAVIARLIKILGSGVTFASEKKCIRYLEKLKTGG